MPLFLPSPSQGVWYLGPLPIRGYALSILTGIIVAVLIARRRWKQWGEDVTQLENMLFISVVMGIIGARVYWIVIEWRRYFGPHHTEPWYHIFFVWEGGLGIWGGIAFGFFTGWLMCRRYHINFLRLADCIAPAFLIAQGIGRLGNWWNQELYGYPTTLPWALQIDLAHRVPGYESYATFHPTFLYEMLWNFAGAGALFVAEKRFKLGRGKLFALYITIYATGRFLVESLRIDPVSSYWGLRVNSWATLLGGLFGLVLFVWLVLNRPGANLALTASVPDESADPSPTPDQGEVAALDQNEDTAKAADDASQTQYDHPGDRAKPDDAEVLEPTGDGSTASPSAEPEDDVPPSVKAAKTVDQADGDKVDSTGDQTGEKPV